jgi:hypothetical protein
MHFTKCYLTLDPVLNMGCTHNDLGSPVAGAVLLVMTIAACFTIIKCNKRDS